MIHYKRQQGDSIEASVEQAIKLAAKHNRKVQAEFNGVKLVINKRLSTKHVIHTWRHIIHSARKAKEAKDLAVRQREIDLLMAQLPQSKLESIEWLAKWIPLSDHKSVKKHPKLVINSLTSLGFVKLEHVGDLAFKDGSASTMKKIEYIAGQVISMLDKLGFVNQIIGMWAIKIATEAKEHEQL